MQRTRAWIALAAAVGCSACASSEPAPELDPSLQELVLDAPPKEIQHRRFLDFGGKVHLLGYDTTAGEVQEPGSSFEVTCYWKSVAKLDDGWALFTHMMNEYGKAIENYDGVGALRQVTNNGPALGPSAWQPGRVYVDKQTIEVPASGSVPYANNVTARVTLVSGVWKDSMRLPVLSGPQDGQNRGIVAHFSTGVVPPPFDERHPKPAEEEEQEEPAEE